MTGWPELVVVAFVAQLAVLPGEKVQFIIAGLATRFQPAVVVAAAGTAFAGWTALELVVGAALQRVLSPVVLDVVAGTMFLVFAVLLVRSAPPASSSAGRETTHATDAAASIHQTDGGTASAPTLDVEVFGYRVPAPFGGFLPIFVMMAAGEFGDKTQLVTIGLAAEYGAHPAIWAGEMLAIIPVSLANAYLFHRFSGAFDVRKAHLVGAALFGFFALDTVLSLTLDISLWEQLVAFVSSLVLGALPLTPGSLA